MFDLLLCPSLSPPKETTSPNHRHLERSATVSSVGCPRGVTSRDTVFVLGRFRIQQVVLENMLVGSILTLYYKWYIYILYIPAP